jgi:hypothetical protein
MIALLVLAGSMAVAAQAQTSGRAQMRVSIPFEFHVGDATLPAGDYLVRQLNTTSDAATLQMSRQDGTAQTIINMIGASGGSQETKLVFRRYGNQYYFAEVWIDGEKDGLQAPKSKTERATQKELAALNVKMERVALSVR